MPNDPLEKLLFYVLIKAKNLINSGKFNLVDRKKNLDFLSSKGLTIKDAKECFLTLSQSDYVKGPEPDYDDSRKESIFVFTKSYEGINMYIKFKIEETDNHEDLLKIISFHD